MMAPETDAIGNSSRDKSAGDESVEDSLRPSFARTVLDKLDAAYNLAWWMTQNDDDAADIVQEACLKAWRFFDGYRGGDSKSWLLSIVRTTIASQARSNRKIPPLDNDAEGMRATDDLPIAQLLAKADKHAIADALATMPPHLREVLILKDVEGLSYLQIAAVIDVPVGTVMSRLSRARDAARAAITARVGKE